VNLVKKLREKFWKTFYNNNIYNTSIKRREKIHLLEKRLVILGGHCVQVWWWFYRRRSKLKVLGYMASNDGVYGKLGLEVFEPCEENDCRWMCREV